MIPYEPCYLVAKLTQQLVAFTPAQPAAFLPGRKEDRMGLH